MATIPYADVLEHTLLPIDAQDVATRIRLLIAGTWAGKEPASYKAYVAPTEGASYESVPYFAAPIVREYADALDSTYRATRALDLPEGVTPYLDPTDASVPDPTTTGMTNAGSPSAVRDGDRLTGAVNTTIAPATGNVSLNYVQASDGLVWCGFYLRYRLTSNGAAVNALPGVNTPGSVIIQWTGQLTTPRYLAEARYDLPAVDYPGAEFMGIFPPDAHGLIENHGGSGTEFLANVSLQVPAPILSNAGDLKVYEFYPLILDTALLDDIAAENIRLPASSPKQVTVRGYVAPDASHTITGWPGGDYTGAVARHTYGGGRTVIDFEQKAAPPGNPQEALQAARAASLRERARLEAGTYPVRLGQRQ